MRIHRTHEILKPWSTGTPVLDAGRLAVVRIEPVLRQRRPMLAIDLYLAGDAGDTIIPAIFADPAVAIERERDPLIFPFGTPGDDAFAAAVSDRVVPILERELLGGTLHDERVIVLADAPRFVAAREAGCFGAAPLRTSLARLAPYRFAWRFARGRSVFIDAPDAVGGWAMLHNAATVAVAASRRDAGALAWYGVAPAAASGGAQVAIVGGDTSSDAPYVIRLDAPGPQSIAVVDPLPFDVALSFDSAEGPASRWFALERVPSSEPAPIPGYDPVGGSGGRIAVVVGRGDSRSRPAADTDEASALVEALLAEGFDASLVEQLNSLDGADLIHLMGVRDGRRARAVVDTGRRLGIPVAVHAYDEEAEHGAWWGGAVGRYCFEYGDDEVTVTEYLRMLAARQVSVDAVTAAAPFAPAEVGLEDGLAALRDAGIVFVATEEEALAIRSRTGRRGTIAVVPPLAAVGQPEAVVALTGPDAFVLVHAPIGPTWNQLLVARAAASANVPLVVTGPVVDASYLERVREFGGPQLVLLAGEPQPRVAAGLRAAAAIVVDAAWVGEGGSRLAAAALAGAQLVLADRRRFPAETGAQQRVDPADVDALSRAIGSAWDAAQRSERRPAAATVTALSPAAAIRAIVRGYATVETPVT